MLPKQQAFSLIAGFVIFLTIISLIRARKLREEYSWIWLLAGAIIFVIVIWYDLLLLIANLVGAVLPTSALFILAILFLILINIFLSVKISQMSEKIKNLAQEITLIKGLTGKEKHEEKK
jgi:hypothetical protein